MSPLWLRIAYHPRRACVLLFDLVLKRRLVSNGGGTLPPWVDERPIQQWLMLSGF